MLIKMKKTAYVKRLISVILFMALAMTLFAGCGKEKKSGSTVNTFFHEITAEQAKEMVDKNQVTVIDISVSTDFEKGHIKGARSFHPALYLDDIKKAFKTSDKLLVVSTTSARSRLMARKLSDQGFQAVYTFGGMKDWPYEKVTGK